MAHDVGMHERSEVVLVVSPREPMPQPQGVEALIGLAGGLAARVVGGVEAVVGAAVGGVLDRVVPGTVGAVLDRIDLTSMVLQRVDLRRVVEQTLNELDLTEIVLDRVDIDAIVDRANLDRVIDRLPLIDLANYIIDEIDLPSIIRESTGGIATDAMNAVRLQSTQVDDAVSHVVDRILLRHRTRSTNAPGTPQSLQGETLEP